MIVVCPSGVAVDRILARNRVRQAAEVGASTLVSACQQCERALAGAAQAARARGNTRVHMRVRDITEVALEAMWDVVQKAEEN